MNGVSSDPHSSSDPRSSASLRSRAEEPASTSAAPRADIRRRSHLSWLALVCSSLLTLLAWDVSARSISARLHDQFVLRCEQIALAITRRMQEHETVLRGGSALFLASKEVTRQEFRDYFHQLELERFFPGIQGVGYVPWLSADALPALEASVRGEGFADFSVHPRGARAHYTPIVYIEPFTGRNLRAFGFDMFSELNRHQAMERAAKTGKATASGIVHLIQETATDYQPGFLLYLPLLEGDALDEASRRSQLRGFIFSPLRTHDLMRGIMGQGPSDIDFALYDEGSEQAFFDTRRPDFSLARPGARFDTDAPKSELSRQRALPIAGRGWTIALWSRPNFGSWLSRWEPLGVLAAGIVINLLLLYILSTGASLHGRAQSLAQEMTLELKLSHAREQQQMRSSLIEKETLLREIHHRVKNNLQVVSSLLSLQRNYTQDERALEPLRQSQSRVLAMAALHEFLYQSKDLAKVDTRAYLTHLVAMLSESYSSVQGVTVSLELAEVALDVDRAIPCGLITNELVSNAFKYAFADQREGTLKVLLEQREDRIVLRVEDDGPGLSSDLDLEAPSTLGLSLVQLLSAQLGGTLQVQSQPSATFTISFPYALRSAA